MKRTVHPVISALREERLRRGLSLEQLGDIAGYTGNHIWCIEHGKQNAKIDVLNDLAQALGMQITVQKVGFGDASRR